MPLGEVLQTLMTIGLLSLLAQRPLPQVVHPHFRMDLHCAYHQGLRHTTDQCTALRYIIKDLIDQGTVQLGQPSISSNPSTYPTHAVPPLVGGIHSIDFDESDDRIHMLSWDGRGLESIVFDDGYGDDGVHEVFLSHQIHTLVVSAPNITLIWIPAPRPMTLPCYSVQTPFIQTPHRGTVDTPEIQYVIRGGRVVRQQPPVLSRPIDPDTVREEVVRKDDEILKQL